MTQNLPSIAAYLRLMRLNAPVGIWLLLWPCWWAIMLASGGLPWGLLAGFGLGALVMRSAGCIINDMADREFDRQVERTRLRPLASGELSMRQAGVLLVFLLAVALGIAVALGPLVVMWGAVALVPVALYPFMKRITWWPQLFLGITFNWGALMGTVAVAGEVSPAAIALYIGGIFWTLGYDTLYAHQDKLDDARIGVKSTALKLGSATKPVVAIFYGLALMGWSLALYLQHGWLSIAAISLLLLSAFHFAWQLKTVQLDEPASCGKVFKSNIALGALIGAALLLG